MIRPSITLAPQLRTLAGAFRWYRRSRHIPGYTWLRLELDYLRLRARIDAAGVRRLWSEMEPLFRTAPESPAKYPEMTYWLRENILRAARVGLAGQRGLRVLDLGCGPGYFLHVCRGFGHEGIGIDLPDEALSPLERHVFSEMSSLLGVEALRRRARIDTLCELPVSGAFDLVVAFLVCFNNHKQETEWRVSEWQAFLSNARRWLRPRGRLWLELNANPTRYGSLQFCDEATVHLFNAEGQYQNGVLVVSACRP